MRPPVFPLFVVFGSLLGMLSLWRVGNLPATAQDAQPKISVLILDGEDLGHEVDAPSRHDGPQILVCTQGSVTARAKSGEVRLERGTAAWVAADDLPIRLEASEPSKLFRATVGL